MLKIRSVRTALKIENTVEGMVSIAKAIQATNPDYHYLMQNYWIWPHDFPKPAADLAALTQEVCELNPTMLDESGVQQSLVPPILSFVVGHQPTEAGFREEASSAVQRLIEYHGTQEIHVQLANLWLQDVFHFGGVEIHPIPNTGDTRERAILYESPFRYGGPPDAVVSFAVVPEAAGLDGKAWRNAVTRIEEVLGLLRGIGLPTLWGREWREAGIAGRGFGSSWVILRRRHQSPWDMSMARSPTLAFMELDHMLRNYSSREVALVEAVFIKSNPTKMERKLLQALYWMGDATFPASNASRFAKLAVAFETAVGGEPSGDDQLKEIGITEMLAERTAFILGSNRDTRLLWHKWVKLLYGSRSRVMHGDVEPISNGELTKWARLVWTAVRAMLNRADRFSTVEDFARWVREQRYTLPM